MDDKIKYRVVGLGVLLAIAIIFVPGLVKKSHKEQKLVRNNTLKVAQINDNNLQHFKSINSAKNNLISHVAKISFPKKAAKKGNFYTVRLATFRNKKYAQSLKHRLENKGFNKVKLLSYQLGHAKMYKIYVGKKITKKSALELQTNLASTFLLQGQLVKKRFS